MCYLLSFTVRLAAVVDKSGQVPLDLSVYYLVLADRHEVVMSVSLLPVRLHPLGKVCLVHHLPTVLHYKIARYDVLRGLQSPALDTSVKRFAVRVLRLLELLVFTQVATGASGVTEIMVHIKHCTQTHRHTGPHAHIHTHKNTLMIEKVPFYHEDSVEAIV